MSKHFKLKYAILLAGLSVWIWLIVVYSRSLPKLFLPHTFKELKEIITILRTIPLEQQFNVFILYCLVSLFKQTFGIPGTAILNVMGGAIYGYLPGIALVSILSAFGCTIAYLLSRDFVGHLFFGRCVSEDALKALQRRVQKYKDSELTFMIVLRIIPFIPHWFINVCSPYAGVGVMTFFWSVLIGVIPYAILCIEAASTLTQLDSLMDIFSFWVMIKLVAIILIILIPLFFKKRILQFWNGQEGFELIEQEIELDLESIRLDDFPLKEMEDADSLKSVKVV